MQPYELISENPESTIVAGFEPAYRSAAQCQSEAAMEADFISLLERQAYERLNITSEDDLKTNLRRQLERLNNIRSSDSRFLMKRTDCILKAKKRKRNLYVYSEKSCVH